jgi:hypothetical protein
VKHHHKHSRHQHRQQQDGPLARESVDPLERAAQVARRTSRALLRQLGLVGWDERQARGPEACMRA